MTESETSRMSMWRAWQNLSQDKASQDYEKQQLWKMTRAIQQIGKYLYKKKNWTAVGEAKVF